MPQEEQEKSVAALFLELVDLFRQYIEQEVRAVIDRAIISPGRRLGFWLGFTIVGATLFALAAIFLSVGLFQLLATLVGAAWIAYLIIGVVLLIGAGILMMLARKLGAQ